MNHEEIVGKVTSRDRASLSISRLPKKTKEAFVGLAEEDFCSDYGMTLKFLFDYYERGELLHYILAEVETLKRDKSDESPRMIKTLSGKMIKVGGKEDEHIEQTSRQEGES